jgi:hypothetical protein
MRALAAAALLLAAACTPAASLPPPTASTVMLMGTRPHHVKCGGVAIDQHTILTAAHCIDAPVTPYVDRDGWAWGWPTHPATLMHRDQLSDVATLHTPLQLPAWATIAPEAPVDGSPACMVHHGSGVPYQVQCGTVLRSAGWTITDLHMLMGVTVTTLVAGPASSGGGLWDADGNLVGICLARNVPDNAALFAPWDALAEMGVQ